MTKRKRKRASRAKQHNARPKGAYVLPTGDYVVQSIGPPDTRGRRIRVRAVHRAEPDAAKVAQALIAIGIERAHDDA